jgi:hypothetical protein
MRGRRRLNPIRDGKPEQLIAGKNVFLDIGEVAKVCSFNRSKDQVSRQRPHLLNVVRVNAEQINGHDAP